MQRHDVGLLQQLVKRHRLATSRSHRIGGHKGVEDQSTRFEWPQPRGDFTTNTTEDDDAHRNGR